MTERRKLFARFLLQICLIVSTNAVHASYWCQGAGEASHLESGPVGKCLDLCHQAQEKYPSAGSVPNEDGALSGPLVDCYDSPSQLSGITPAKLFSQRGKAVDLDSERSKVFASIAKSQISTRQSGQFYSSLLPQFQALHALNTVVLLH